MDVKCVSWEQVKAPLEGTFDGDGSLIAEDVRKGFAYCWKIGDCYAVTRREGDELVIMCLAGKNLKDVAGLILSSAKSAGCKTVRYHTKRDGLPRHLKEFGFKVDEYICTARL